MLQDLQFRALSAESQTQIYNFNVEARWLRHLFMEGLVECEKIAYKRIFIMACYHKAFDDSILQTDISIYRIFDFDSYFGISTPYLKCQYQLDFFFKTLYEYDFGVPTSFWQAGYDHCIKNNFLYNYAQKRKPLVYKSLKMSFSLYIELDIYEFKLFIESTSLEGSESQRVLVAILIPAHIDNFHYFILTKNKDHTFNIEDKAYYSSHLFISNIDLNNPEVYKSDKIRFPKRPQ
jgi:hypothetical protein